MTSITNDALLRARTDRCFSAAFSDSCDRLGLYQQTLPPRLQRLSGQGTIVGRARTFTSVAVDALPARHYGGEIDFIDSLRPGDIAVGRIERDAAGWGELFSAAAVGRGAVGVVLDGLARDLTQVRALGFSLHGIGTRPTDSLGRVSLQLQDEPVVIGDVQVASDDLVVADDDGVVIVPAERAVEVLDLALSKATTERDAKQLLLDGGTLAEVWERFHVL